MKKRKTDIKRALSSWGFITGIAGTVITIVISAAGQIISLMVNGVGQGLYHGFHDQIFIDALYSDVVLLFVPILCALPYTSAFVDDYKSGYTKFYLPRSGIMPYLKGKVTATAISGGLVLFIGIMTTYIVSVLVFTPMEIVPQEDMLMRSMFPYILGSACIYFLFGSLWSLIGALLASITMSRYIAYASPFILYYVLVILNERYIKNLYVLNPQIWLTEGSMWPGGNWGLALFLIELIIVIAIGLGISIGRRVKSA